MLRRLDAVRTPSRAVRRSSGKALHPVELVLKTMMRLHSDKKLQLGGEKGWPRSLYNFKKHRDPICSNVVTNNLNVCEPIITAWFKLPCGTSCEFKKTKNTHAHTGTQLIKSLLDDSEAARQAMARIPGGLDWLCQGPEEGNVLIHWREG